MAATHKVPFANLGEVIHSPHVYLNAPGAVVVSEVVQRRTCAKLIETVRQGGDEWLTTDAAVQLMTNQIGNLFTSI